MAELPNTSEITTGKYYVELRGSGQANFAKQNTGKPSNSLADVA
jgi:hypothetical protein